MIPLVVSLVHFLGVLTAIHAVMSTRTSQGAIAWAVAAITFPYIVVPSYWIFGQSKFDGYRLLRHSRHLASDDASDRVRLLLEKEGDLVKPQTPEQESHLRLLTRISKLPVTRGNSAQLLIDGERTFDAIFLAIRKAKRYVLVQFYILKDDGLGKELKRVLIERAKAGVAVFVLYDEMGSKDLSGPYTEELQAAGVKIHPFNATKQNSFRVNFRNHRKIVVVDGEIAFIGGHNVGDEYLGKDPVLTPWRDTHVAVKGPVVKTIQVPFVEDWNWSTGQKQGLSDTLDWTPKVLSGESVAAACIPTGPADKLETGTLWFLYQINSARKRLWIVSPYFVPDEQLLSALQLAAMRGVDVRIIIPKNPDHFHVYLSGISYLQEAEDAGVKIYRYQPGFLHQKVVLIDDEVACIGTANLDNRSMRLNFEITLLIADRGFASEVEKMLLDDLANCKLASAKEYSDRSLPFRLLVRVARLLAPIQ